MTDLSAATHPGGTAGVNPTYATGQCHGERCECRCTPASYSPRTERLPLTCCFAYF